MLLAIIFLATAASAQKLRILMITNLPSFWIISFVVLNYIEIYK